MRLFKFHDFAIRRRGGISLPRVLLQWGRFQLHEIIASPGQTKEDCMIRTKGSRPEKVPRPLEFRMAILAIVPVVLLFLIATPVTHAAFVGTKCKTNVKFSPTPTCMEVCFTNGELTSGTLYPNKDCAAPGTPLNVYTPAHGDPYLLLCFPCNKITDPSCDCSTTPGTEQCSNPNFKIPGTSITTGYRCDQLKYSDSDAFIEQGPNSPRCFFSGGGFSCTP